MTPQERQGAINVLLQAMLAAGVPQADAAKAAPALIDEAASRGQPAPPAGGNSPEPAAGQEPGSRPKALSQDNGFSVDLARWSELLHPRDDHGKFTSGGGGGSVASRSSVYNDIPETRGTSRTKSTYESGGGTGRNAEDQARLASFRAGTVEKVAEPITVMEARGDSRSVTHAEFQRLAAEGKTRLGAIQSDRQPNTGLDKNWTAIKARTYAEVQKSWGGATIDPRTGKDLPQGADKYAITVKPAGMDKLSVPENAGAAQFSKAMDAAKARYAGELAKGGSYLGVFHDDENNRIDIDPVTVVDSVHEVETIGAYTHAIGGAYHFKSGDGFWPPHVLGRAA